MVAGLGRLHSRGDRIMDIRVLVLGPQGPFRDRLVEELAKEGVSVEPLERGLLPEEPWDLAVVVVRPDEPWDALGTELADLHSSGPVALAVDGTADDALVRRALEERVLGVLDRLHSDPKGLLARLRDLRAVRRALASLRETLDTIPAGKNAGSGHGPEARVPRVLLVGSPEVYEGVQQPPRDFHGDLVHVVSLDQARDKMAEGFDVVVVDHDLDGRPGIEALRELLTLGGPGTQFIYVVGFTAADTAIEALRWGASSFLLKPLDADGFWSQVRELGELGSRRAREQERLEEWRRRAVQALDDVERALKALY